MKKSINPTLKIGDSVKVNKGQMDIMYETHDMSGWQGRIFNKFTDGGYLFMEVEFDSITIKQMPEEYIGDYIQGRYNYFTATFVTDEITLTEPRDTVRDVKATIKEINKKFGYQPRFDRMKKLFKELYPANITHTPLGISIGNIPGFVLLLDRHSRAELKTFFSNEWIRENLNFTEIVAKRGEKKQKRIIKNEKK
jgi:hypothetical protein